MHNRCTNKHKLSGLKQILLSYSSGIQKSKMSLTGLKSRVAILLEGKYPLLWVFQLQEAKCIPWLLAPSSIFVVQSLSCVWLFETTRTAAHQASLSFTIFWSLLKLVSIESVIPSNHLVLCHPLLLLPSIFPRTRVFSNESALLIK